MTVLLSRIIVLLLVIPFLGSCRTGPDIKWRLSDPSKDALLRKNEILLYKDAEGHFCLNPIDSEFVITYCMDSEHGPIDSPPKFYVLTNSKGGFYRAQANEVIAFKDTKDYSCLSPQDTQALLNWCFDIPGQEPEAEEIETDYARNL